MQTGRTSIDGAPWLAWGSWAKGLISVMYDSNYLGSSGYIGRVVHADVPRRLTKFSSQKHFLRNNKMQKSMRAFNEKIFRLICSDDRHRLGKFASNSTYDNWFPQYSLGFFSISSSSFVLIYSISLDHWPPPNRLFLLIHSSPLFAIVPICEMLLMSAIKDNSYTSGPWTRSLSIIPLLCVWVYLMHR